jgi:hypothetical protein
MVPSATSWRGWSRAEDYRVAAGAAHVVAGVAAAQSARVARLLATREPASRPLLAPRE